MTIRAGIAKIMDLMVSDRMIKLQVYTFLCGSHIFQPLSRGFNQMFHRESSSVMNEKIDETESEVKRRNSSGDEWDWKEIRHPYRIMAIYEPFTSMYMCYSLTKAIIKLELIGSEMYKIIGLDTRKPIHCFLLGRLVVTDDRYMSILATIWAITMHLLWRVTQNCKERQLHSASIFLLCTTKDLRKHSKLMAQSQKEDGEPNRCRHEAKIERFMNDMLCLRFPVPVHDDVSGQDGYMKTVYVTKPNRTLESNVRLRKLIATNMFISIVLFVICALILCPIWIIKELFDKSFILGYPGCDEKLEELSKKGLINDYSINWTLWRTKAVLADLVENSILWADSGISVFCGLQVSILLNYDLVVYWRFLHERTLLLRRKFEANQDFTSVCSDCGDSLTKDTGCQGCFRRNTTTIAMHRRANDKRRYPDRQSRTDLSDDPIGLLKHQFCDFFREIRRVDSFMSDTISLALSVWLSIFSIYVYVVQSIDLKSGPGRNMLLMGPLSVIALNYTLILILHRQCSKTYPVLCSIMAINQSPRDKKALMLVLDYFIDRSTCFRLFRQTPFLPSTYLAMVGWSFSCFFIITSLNRHP